MNVKNITLEYKILGKLHLICVEDKEAKSRSYEKERSFWSKQRVVM